MFSSAKFSTGWEKTQAISRLEVRKHMEQKIEKIDKEVFDKFFTESYCMVDYETVKEEFEALASAGFDIFTGSYEA